MRGVVWGQPRAGKNARSVMAGGWVVGHNNNSPTYKGNNTTGGQTVGKGNVGVRFTMGINTINVCGESTLIVNTKRK